MATLFCTKTHLINKKSEWILDYTTHSKPFYAMCNNACIKLSNHQIANYIALNQGDRLFYNSECSTKRPIYLYNEIYYKSFDSALVDLDSSEWPLHEYNPKVCYINNEPTECPDVEPTD